MKKHTHKYIIYTLLFFGVIATYQIFISIYEQNASKRAFEPIRSHTPPIGEIKGIVEDLNGKPIENYLVRISYGNIRQMNHKVTTDKKGEFSVSSLHYGNYNVGVYLPLITEKLKPNKPHLVSDFWHYYYVKSVTTTKESPSQSIVFSVPRLPLILGQVTDEKNEPIRGVNLQFKTTWMKGNRKITHEFPDAKVRSNDYGEFVAYVPNTINLQEPVTLELIPSHTFYTPQDSYSIENFDWTFSTTGINLIMNRKDMSEFRTNVDQLTLFNGSVIDKQTKQPIPRTEIIYFEDQKGYMLDLSRDNGKFELALEPSQINNRSMIRFVDILHKPKDIKVSTIKDNTNLQIELEPYSEFINVNINGVANQNQISFILKSLKSDYIYKSEATIENNSFKIENVDTNHNPFIIGVVNDNVIGRSEPFMIRPNNSTDIDMELFENTPHLPIQFKITLLNNKTQQPIKAVQCHVKGLEINKSCFFCESKVSGLSNENGVVTLNIPPLFIGKIAISHGMYFAYVQDLSLNYHHKDTTTEMILELYEQ